MKVDVRLASALREAAGGRSRIVLELPDGAATTVGALLDELDRVHPVAGRRVRDEQGRLRRHVNVFVGEENCKDAGALDTPLVAGVEVSILPAVSGGSGH